MSNMKSREIIIKLMEYINSPYLPIIEEACTHIGHPADESDNFQNMYHRCYCRSRQYKQRYYAGKE